MNQKNHDHNEWIETQMIENRIITISEGVSSALAKRVINALLIMEAQNAEKPITIYLNSPGGEVSSGFAIFDTIRFINSPVRIVVTGLAASAATIIFCAVKKDRRYTMPNAKFMIHQPSIGGQIYGQASDLEITAREILKTRQKANEILAKECGQPLEKVEVDTTRDYWMSAGEAKEYGLATKIIESISDLR